MDGWKNKLYFGDNLRILREYVPDESVDLVYLDPPFNSKADYNVLFKEQTGEESMAQITAFEDTWHWGQEAEEAYADVIQRIDGKLASLLASLRQFLGQNDMMAYLTMMAIRLVELHRVLKPTGSLYLHCDPTASHYLKIVLDAVFGPRSFRNEIVWRRSATHGKVLRYSPVHDIILFYTKSDEYTWNAPKKPFMREHVRQYLVEENGRWHTKYYGNVLTGAGRRNGESGQKWRGFNPTAKGRHWAIPKKLLETVQEELGEDLSGLSVLEKLERLYELGYVHIEPGQAWPAYGAYVDPRQGQAVPDIWAYQPYTQGTVFGTDQGIDEDVRWLNPRDKERLGYPTQKPEGLLERIIKASSNEGDLVLDPFCGCGTAIAVAERLKRRWIGIDITHLAVALMRHRLHDAFRSELSPYEVIGDPKDLASARALAQQDRFQFEWWALGLVDARPGHDKRKGADTGVDGYIYFLDDAPEKPKKIVIQVKSGHVTVSQVRDLKGVMEREGAAIGALITLEEPTQPMLVEAATAGFYESPALPGRRFPRLQILTIQELLDGRRLEYPQIASVTFQRASRKRKEGGPEQQSLL